MRMQRMLTRLQPTRLTGNMARTARQANLSRVSLVASGALFFPWFYSARRRMLNDSFPRVYVCTSTPAADASSGFIDAHDSPFRAVNKIANLSTSIRLAMAKRDYTECALTVRVIYVLTIDDRDLYSSGNGSRCVKNIPMHTRPTSNASTFHTNFSRWSLQWVYFFFTVYVSERPAPVAVNLHGLQKWMLTNTLHFSR